MLALALTVALQNPPLPPNSTAKLDSEKVYVDTTVRYDTAHVGWVTVTTYDTVQGPPPDTTTIPIAKSCTGAQATTTAQINGSFATDTLCIRGGTYGAITLNLNGKSYKAWPGERVVFSGGGTTLQINGNDVTIWGPEVKGSTNQVCVNRRGDRVKMIHMVVHHCYMSGIGDYFDAPGGEDYGNLIFQTGMQNTSCTNNKDHGIYIQNDGPDRKLVAFNIGWNNQAYTYHVWSSSPQNVKFLTLRGNISSMPRCRPDYMLDGTTIEGMVFDSNVAYHAGSEVLQAGLYGSHKDIRFRYNFLPGQVSIKNFATLDSTGNKVGASASRDTVIVLNAGKYEKGRRHIAVFNPSQRQVVTVSIPGLAAWSLVRVDTMSANANAYFGQGTLGSGTSVSIPIGGAPYGSYVLRPR